MPTLLVRWMLHQGDAMRSEKTLPAFPPHRDTIVTTQTIASLCWQPWPQAPVVIANNKAEGSGPCTVSGWRRMSAAVAGAAAL